MAKPVTVTISHELGKEGARARIDEGFDQLKASIAGNMGLKFDREWDGDTLHFKAKGMGQRMTGDIELFPEHIRITVTLPALLAGMAEKVAGKLEKQGQILLEDRTGKT